MRRESAGRNLCTCRMLAALFIEWG